LALALPDWLWRLTRRYALRRGAPIKAATAFIVGITIRVTLVAIAFIHSLFGRKSFDKAEFVRFYEDFMRLSDIRPNGRVFALLFMKYLQRPYFLEAVAEGERPSLEIGVFDGVTTRLYFPDYQFDFGTELFHAQFKDVYDKTPHQQVRPMNLLDKNTFPPERFRTLVMIHSIDDFTSPDTSLAFKAFSQLMEAGGRVYLSGATERWRDTYIPFRIAKWFRPELNFFDFRHIREIASEDGFTLIRYDEFNRDPLYIAMSSIDNFLSKQYYPSNIRRFFWSMSLARRLHISANGVLAEWLAKREASARTRALRGVNFFAVLQKDE
jgi:hypothetical protein